mgnify:FL=1
MGYSDEKQRIIDYVTNDGMIIELTPNKDNEKAYYQELEIYADMTKLGIRYPGYKTTQTKCDYCVCLVDRRGEHPISHVEIMNDLYDKTTMQNFEHMKKYVEDIARIGRNVEIENSLEPTFDRGFSFEQLTDLMFYIAIQEDINYPERYYQGRKMCFYRYLEAIYCKIYSNHSLKEAILRAKANYIPKNWNDVGNLYDIVAQIKGNLTKD